MTASVRLPEAASLSRSRMLLTTRIAVESPAAGSPADRLDVVGPGDGDEPEEDEHEQIAEAPIAVRERTAGVGNPGEDARQSDDKNRHATDVDEIRTEDDCEAERGVHRSLDRTGVDESASRHSREPLPVGVVGSPDGIVVVVGKVRADLQKQGSDEREGGRNRIEDPVSDRQTGANDHRGRPRRQRLRAGRHQPSLPP